MRRPAWLFAIFVGALSAPGVCLAETIPFPTIAEQTTSAQSTSTGIEGMGCDPTRPETCVTESPSPSMTVISLPILDVALEPSLTLALDVVYGRRARSVYGSVYTMPGGSTAAPTSTTTSSQPVETTTAIAPLETYSNVFSYGRIRNGRTEKERAPAPPQSRRPSNRIIPPPPPPPTPAPEPTPITPLPEPIIVPPDPAPSGTQTPIEPLPPSTFDGTGLPEGSGASPVPEPGTAVLTGIGLALIAAVLRLQKLGAR